VLRWLVCQLLGSEAGTFSINKFRIDLKSHGIAVGKDTLHSYLSHLDGHEELIHVCASVHHPETFVREIRALQDAASEFLRASRAQITLLGQPPVLEVPAGVTVVAARDWLLDETSARAAGSEHRRSVEQWCCDWWGVQTMLLRPAQVSSLTPLREVFPILSPLSLERLVLQGGLLGATGDPTARRQQEAPDRAERVGA